MTISGAPLVGFDAGEVHAGLDQVGIADKTWIESVQVATMSEPRRTSSGLSTGMISIAEFLAHLVGVSLAILLGRAVDFYFV